MKYATDSAVILFQKPQFEFPSALIKLLPIDRPINLGCEVGWLGFPAIESWTMCFYSTESDGASIVGVMTAYRANRTGGDALPGLSVAQDVSHFHDIIQQVKSMDDAKKKKQELESKPENKDESIDKKSD